jgi:hypothetical protein
LNRRSKILEKDQKQQQQEEEEVTYGLAQLEGWLDKQVWKEINDILRVHQFDWLSNGKDSCWIRMMNGKE